MARILLIDDEEEFGSFVEDWLTEQRHTVRRVTMPDEGLEIASAESFDLILLDNCMPRLTGLEFLEELIAKRIDVPVILMTFVHLDDTVIKAINLGAFGYVIKPTNPGEFERAFGPDIRKALAITRRPAPVRVAEPHEPVDESAIVGRSKKMIDVLMDIGRLAKLDGIVLVLGETGTGKDLVARALHTHSRRHNKPFIPVNCAAFTDDNLLRAELFGHEANAFTGADGLRKGLFEHAHGGTLFLDELAEMSLSMQASLLRVLENREVTRIMGKDPIPVDVRVIAATCGDLKAHVSDRSFREDLYYRLNRFCIRLPPLRERKEDIELLARRFLHRLFGPDSAPELLPETLHRLREFPWPGNVRQLQNVLGKAAVKSRYQQIHPADLDFEDEDGSPTSRQLDSEQEALAALRSVIAWAWQHTPTDLWPYLRDQLEREMFHYAHSQTRNQVELTERLGVARNTVRDRVKKFGLEGSAPEESP